MALTNEELEQRLIAAEKRIESSAVHSKRTQKILDEILASQKDLRAKHEDLERQLRLKKSDMHSRLSTMIELFNWLLAKLRKEADDLEMPQKIREEQNELADKKS